MFTHRILRNVFFSSSCVAGALAGTMLGGPAEEATPEAQLALEQLQSDFHGATTLADYDLMHSLWTDNAVFHGPAGPVVGPDAIADFFANGPRWGQVASLAPTYKTWFEIDGNVAKGQFECVLVDTFGADPVTTPLSTIPFGSQNQGVEIVQHSTASITAVRDRGVWKIQVFRGAAGTM